MKSILANIALAAILNLQPTTAQSTRIGILPNNSSISLIFESSNPASIAPSSSSTELVVTITSTSTVSLTTYTSSVPQSSLQPSASQGPSSQLSHPQSSNPNPNINSGPGTSAVNLTLLAPSATAILHEPHGSNSNASTNGTLLPPQIPIQPDQPSNCDTWILVTKGTDCIDLAAKANITLQEFEDWNPAVGADCGELLAGVWACVGVVGGEGGAGSGNGTAVAGRRGVRRVSGEEGLVVGGERV